MLKLPNDIAPGASPEDLEDPNTAGEEQPADADEVDPEDVQLPEEPVEEPPQPDIPAGPTQADVVGDRRKITVYAVGPKYLGDESIVGEAWQDENGDVHGTGICAVMLFEPLARTMYKNSSIGMDISPLSVLAFRLSRGPFVRISWSGDGDVPAA